MRVSDAGPKLLHPSRSSVSLFTGTLPSEVDGLPYGCPAQIGAEYTKSVCYVQAFLLMSIALASWISPASPSRVTPSALHAFTGLHLIR